MCTCTSKNRDNSSQDNTLRQISFCADSAYQYIHDQVSFGPRVPGTQAHYQCMQYLVNQLKRFGAEVEIQQGQMPNYEGKAQQIVNIIGHLDGVHSNSSNSVQTNRSRILLCAHYDSRPWADQEEDYTNRRVPVIGANDGASGVGVLLEVARQVSLMSQEEQAKYALDIIFFDCEDMGTPNFYIGKERENTWCLGSQLWANNYKSMNVISKAPKYSFGILLDMVGAPNAVFPREYFSESYASNYVEKVWRTAKQLGYGPLFIDQKTYPITDDHYYINTIAEIPCVDILHYDINNGTGFAEWWHTQHDDMTNISPSTLEAVGKTVLAASKK